MRVSDLKKIIKEELEIILSEKKADKNPDDKDLPGHQPKKYYKGLDKTTKKKREKQFEKGKKKSDSDSSAYPEKHAGDDDVKTKPSKHTRAVRKRMKKTNESDISENSVSKKAEKSLKKKAEEYNVSLGILKQVYRRGMAAWKTGHRPGASQEAWAHGRVNSFLNKGETYKTTDSDLAKKWRDQKKKD